MGKQWKQWQTLFSWAPESLRIGDCSHEIKSHLPLGRKAVTNLDSILKSKDVTLPTKVHIVKGMVFPTVMYGCESWTIKKTEHWRTDTFKLWCCRRLLESFGLQGDQTSLSWRKSTLNFHWKDWCWGWSSSTLATWWEEPTHWKRSWCWERPKAKAEVGGKGCDRQHYWLNGHESEHTPRDGEGQERLVCCTPWSHKRVWHDIETEQQQIITGVISHHICKLIFKGRWLYKGKSQTWLSDWTTKSRGTP